MTILKTVLEHMIKEPEINMDEHGFEQFYVPQGQRWIMKESQVDFEIDNVQVDNKGQCSVNGEWLHGDFSRIRIEDDVVIDTFMITQIKLW
jgi:hypothetical protein